MMSLSSLDVSASAPELNWILCVLSCMRRRSIGSCQLTNRETDVTILLKIPLETSGRVARRTWMTRLDENIF